MLDQTLAAIASPLRKRARLSQHPTHHPSFFACPVGQDSFSDGVPFVVRGAFALSTSQMHSKLNTKFQCTHSTWLVLLVCLVVHFSQPCTIHQQCLVQFVKQLEMNPLTTVANLVKKKKLTPLLQHMVTLVAESSNMLHLTIALLHTSSWLCGQFQASS